MTTPISALWGGGGTATLWTSGATVEQGALVRSPLDQEIYRRYTATGSGVTDPADDTVNYTATSFRRTASIPTPAIRLVASTLIVGNVANGATKTAIGAIAAGVRTLLLSLTGRGNISYLATYQGADPGVMRLELLVDGRVIFDSNEPGGATNLLLRILGNSGPSYDGATVLPTYIALQDAAPLEFRRSLQFYATPTNAWNNAGNTLAYILRSNAS